jgi:hypothetical protein
MEADEFYQAAKEPTFPDEMIFQIHAANPDNPGTFSRDGVNDTVDLMDAFIMARIFGTWKKTGLPPKHMKVHIKIEWEPEAELDLHTGEIPWFDGDLAGEGLTLVDGNNRIPRKPLDK